MLATITNVWMYCSNSLKKHTAFSHQSIQKDDPLFWNRPSSRFCWYCLNELPSVSLKGVPLNISCWFRPLSSKSNKSALGWLIKKLTDLKSFLFRLYVRVLLNIVGCYFEFQNDKLFAIASFSIHHLLHLAVCCSYCNFF